MIAESCGKHGNAAQAVSRIAFGTVTLSIPFPEWNIPRRVRYESIWGVFG